MFSPLDKEFNTIMKNRYPIKLSNDKYDVFYTETRNLFSRLMKTILETEITVEKLRHKLNKLSRFTIRGIFDKMDVLRKNYLTKDDV